MTRSRQRLLPMSAAAAEVRRQEDEIRLAQAARREMDVKIDSEPSIYNDTMTRFMNSI